MYLVSVRELFDSIMGCLGSHLATLCLKQCKKQWKKRKPQRKQRIQRLGG